MDTTTVFASKVLSLLLCVLGLIVFCLIHEGSDKMGEMLNNDAVLKELTLRPWLCYKDLVSMQHIALLGVTPLKRLNLLLGFLISGRGCKRPVDWGPIRMNPLCDEIPSPPLCWVSWVVLHSYHDLLWN